MREEGIDIAHIHLKYINPLPRNLGEMIKNFDHVFVAELNNGQLIRLIRDQFLKDAKGINKIQGQPFQITEIKDILKHNLQ